MTHLKVSCICRSAFKISSQIFSLYHKRLFTTWKYLKSTSCLPHWVARRIQYDNVRESTKHSIWYIVEAQEILFESGSEAPAGIPTCLVIRIEGAGLLQFQHLNTCTDAKLLFQRQQL